MRGFSYTLSMVVKSITRSYSKSINTKDYGLTDSWLKVESSMTAEITEAEQENIKSLSNQLQLMTKEDVTSTVKDITARMKEDAMKRSHPLISTESGDSKPSSINTPPPLTRPKNRL